ncbi:Quinoprotein glucose dehydrogenase [Luteitalea pratensis]|uniref:Quinoprotein glucose dehydrogenase n=1 Tax=Luteitalea pratensis TaxID=1855912 RepID=A0A143PTJ0_LUTPR|nr:PQQ-binding-like beta-propeller repeat protein [Luteitalea pratensis]AMY11124.1 Quinoprotein glucose dehydrogenase [Luteitalea pratensis]
MPRRLPFLLTIALVALACAHVWTQQRAARVDWRAHGADAAHTQHSPAGIITPANVKRLRVAWTYKTGDGRADNRSQIQCNPIVVDGVLYASSAQLKIFALDADTGTPKWVFDPFARPDGDGPSSLGVNRGVTYWAEAADKRIFMGAGPYLYALNADTGTPIASFGEQGRIDLRLGLDADATGLSVLSNTPGSIYKDLIIVPTRLSEGPGRAAPGHVRAFDVRTGQRRWIFHTIPHPGEAGHDTWPTDAWQRIGAANNWAGMAVDEARGLVFVPTGSAAFDFWGGNRHGANLYANSLLALRADTGERVWHFQFVHHDLWDRDLPTAPVLGTVTKSGRSVDVVMQATKTGELYVFERETGTPLWPIEEVPVPQTTLKGEQSWPTQPRSTLPPIARQEFSADTLTSRTPEARAFVEKQLIGARPFHKWQPPSEEGTVIFPGFDGGAEWGGQAFDPATGTFFVNANNMAWITHMLPIDAARETTQVARGRRHYQVNCVACHGLERKGDPSRTIPGLIDIDKRQPREAVNDVVAYGRGQMPPFTSLPEDVRKDIIAYLFGDAPKEAPKVTDDVQTDIPYIFGGYTRLLDDKGYPGVAPPWGTLTAVDVGAGTIKWQVTLGDRPEARQPKAPPTGTENYGGPAITAGGVLFIGATNDEKFRAFDMRDGKQLWEASLPAGGYATPATYVVDGRQFVVIAAGGGKMGTKSGDTYVAFALPERTAGSRPRPSTR